MKRLLMPLVAASLLAATSSAFAADKMTVLLDWFVNPDHAPLYVALERGYFRDAGLEIDFKAPADPNAPPKLVAAGKADLAVSYQPQLHVQIDRGLPLVRVATLVATPLSSLVVLRDSGIRSIADLKGKIFKYLFSINSVGNFGMKLNSVNFFFNIFNNC